MPEARRCSLTPKQPSPPRWSRGTPAATTRCSSARPSRCGTTRGFRRSFCISAGWRLSGIHTSKDWSRRSISGEAAPLPAEPARPGVLFRRAAQDVIAELAGIGQIRHLPAVEIVLRHAILGEALEAVGIAGRLRAEQAIAADFFGRAAVVDLVELVPAAEFRRQAVPEQLHQLDALLGLVAAGAAHVAVDVGTDLGVLEVAGV